MAALARVGVVGGGIVGLALARALTLRRPGLTVVVLEKEGRLAAHQTGHNSGVVHAGLYYEPGSLKARLCVQGMRWLREYCAAHKLPYVACGKLVVARNEQEEARLHALLSRAQANGVAGVRLLGPAAIAEREPNVTGRLALHSPDTAIVDFGAVARQLAVDVIAGGGQVRTSTRVVGVRPDTDGVVVTTDEGNERFDQLVNCAGLQADRVARMAGDGAGPRIVPFRGDYFLLRPRARHLVSSLIYPVPDPRYPFLGVHLTPRVDREVLVGPNALIALDREGYRLTAFSRRDVVDTVGWPGFWQMARRHWRTGMVEVRRSLSRRFVAAEARRYVPALRAQDLVRGPSGIRAQALERDGTLVDDFRISRCGSVVNVRNAPSPAATSALAIAELLATVVLEGHGEPGTVPAAESSYDVAVSSQRERWRS